MARTYGWRPDLPDHRDHLFAPRRGGILPGFVDLRPGCTPVEDQGELGSCTGNAIAGALEFLYRKAVGKVFNFSRLFIYYEERRMEGTIRQDAGAEIRDGVKAVAKVGAPAEYLCPYKIERFRMKPAKAAYKDALRHRISEYRRVIGLRDLRAALADDFPVVFGFSVYESFESDAVAKTGIVPFPEKNERMLGGHAVLAVGYDDAKEHVIVRNSWGPDWGDKGYCYLPYRYITTANLSDDFWTITK